MSTSKQTQLIAKLKELFMMDQADLDFGIYRIMHARHDEIESFLQHDLLPTIRQTLQANGKNEAAKQELDELTKTLTSAGMNPDESPKVQELKALLGDGANASLEKDEEDIFSHLHTFFSRYYDGGDFMSLRHYRQETYSPLPMNGEEVKLHWANADQYYIKSAENFTHYVFNIGEGDHKKHIRFELVQASTEQNNKKESSDKERRFMLDENQPLSLRSDAEGDTLILHFSYQPDNKKRKQKDLNTQTIETIQKLSNEDSATASLSNWQDWQAALLTPMPTEKNKTRTAMEKYLTDYTAKNSFDYFIHKNLGGFLRRELDFFIKNELLLIDDIIPTLDVSDDGAAADNTGDTSLASQLLSNERSLRKVAAFKRIAQKLIAFLAQLEDFQKRLWLKKKFVLESNYCFTLDRVPTGFYAEIAANSVQVQEWRDLGVLADDVSEINADFLQQQPYLMVDTGHFDEDFKQRLLAEVEDLDEQTDGLLIHSENFQALNLMQERYREQVKCIYIDPPYNTGNGDFCYKDSYQHSSWASHIYPNLTKAKKLLSQQGVFFSSIDDNESSTLKYLLGSVFGNSNHVADIIWQKRYAPDIRTVISDAHEFIYCYANNLSDFKKVRQKLPLTDFQTVVV